MPLTLFQAIELEDIDAIDQILNERPAEVSERDTEHRTALHYAAEIANVDMFTKILNADVSLINSQDASGFTPLFVAVTAGNSEILRILINRNTQLDQVDFDNHTVVHWAVVCGQLETLQQLIKSGAPTSMPDLHGAYPLHYAVTLDDVPPKHAETILNVLLRATADVNCRDADNRTPLLWAASCGNTFALQRLIEAGGSKYAVDKDNLNALHCAANHGYIDTVVLLLKQTSSRKMLEGKDRNGDTPLFYAATYGHYDCVRLLLDANADPNHVDKRLRTSAHCAAAKGQIRVLKLLRQFGASFDIQNYRGDLPIHEAVQTGNTEVVSWLLDLNPANLNVGNFHGRTALHLSAANGDLELVKLLCERGAYPNALMIFQSQMCTPLDLAKKRHHQLVIDYLTCEHHAQLAREMPTNMLLNERTSIEENVKSAKIRWSQAKKNGPSTHGGDLQNESSEAPSSDQNKLMLKMQRRSSSLAEDGVDLSTSSNFQLLPKSTSTSDLRLPPIDHQSSNVVNKGAQTDEAMSQKIGRLLVEEAIRKVVNEESWNVITSLSDHEYKTSNLPRISNKKRTMTQKVKRKQQRENNLAPEEEDDYPQYVATDEEKAFTSYYSNTQKPNKRVTVASNGALHAREIDDDDGVFDGYSPRMISSLLQSGAASTGTATGNSKTRQQFVHEKAIFHELTHLKRIQIQYGKVQERVLVRSLINNFCKMHGLNMAHFRYNTFYAWEKFLYDQLKLIYLEERNRIQTLGGPHSAAQFERRLRKVSPLNERLRELTRIYNTHE